MSEVLRWALLNLQRAQEERQRWQQMLARTSVSQLQPGASSPSFQLLSTLECASNQRLCWKGGRSRAVGPWSTQHPSLARPPFLLPLRD